MAEAAAEGHDQSDGGDCRFRVVRVDVDDGHVEPLRKVARVPGRPALRRISGEADLVVRDHVQRSARGVAGETLQVECLRDNALGGE